MIAVYDPGADLPEQEDATGPDEIRLVLDLLLSHKKDLVQTFLRARGLAFSGTRSELRERLLGYLSSQVFELSDLVRLLNRIEGWGNQHIYLYKASGALIQPWLDQAEASETLRRFGLEALFRRQRPVIAPAVPTLISVEWSLERMRFVWVEGRRWEEKLPEHDRCEDGIVWHAYQVHVGRGLIAFDWDLVSGHAMLSIQRLPYGDAYSLVRDRFERELEPILGLSQFLRLRVSPAIKRIEGSGEVRCRQVAYQTRRGSKVSFTSATRSRGVSSDPDVERAERLLGSGSAGVAGNFYWRDVRSIPGREVHCRLHARDQRIAILGEHPEEDIRYVLSRIRSYCS